MDYSFIPLISDFLRSFASILFTVLIIIAVIFLILYLMFSYGLFRMSKNRNRPFSWLAWIPVLHLYTLGDLCEGKTTIGSLTLKYVDVILPLGLICVVSFNDLPYGIGTILSVAFAFYFLAVLYKLYYGYTNSRSLAVLFLVLSFFFWFLVPVFVFALRNKNYILNTIFIPVTPAVKQIGDKSLINRVYGGKQQGENYGL